MTFGILGGGSWGTAITKIVTDKKHKTYWWVRDIKNAEHITEHGKNPNYLSSLKLSTENLKVSVHIKEVIEKSDVILIVIPSAYITNSFSSLHKDVFKSKHIVSAVKGIIPESNLLLHEYLNQNYGVGVQDFSVLLGPSHSEEVAQEKLTYLTMCGQNNEWNKKLCDAFRSSYIHTIPNSDIWGAQYAAILKNIYALGGGIANGLNYGDNFLSVFFSNCIREIFYFLKNNPKVHYSENIEGKLSHSVYIGDFLVTAYSKYSRNREFGILVGEGYTIPEVQAKIKMTAEGYTIVKSVYHSHLWDNCQLPILETIYNILWNNASAKESFKSLESQLI